MMENFTSVQGDTRLIVLHPQYNDQRRVLWQYFTPESSVIYVRLEGADLNIEALQEQLNNASAQQNGVDAIQTVDYLIIDEADRAQSEALDVFLTSLLSETRAQIVILSRDIPTAAMWNGPLGKYARFVPRDQARMLYDHSERNGDQDLLEVRAFGSGHVRLNGRPVTNWDGLLPRNLFFYLVDRGMVTRDAIFATFWPTMTVKEATNVFHVTKRKVSEVLGIDLTTYSSGFYRISPNIELSYDVMRFSQLIQDSNVVDEDEAAILLEQALSLARGRFLDQMDAEWVIHRRSELMQTVSDAFATLAATMHSRGEFDRALGLYLRAAHSNPHREDVVTQIMEIYAQKNHADEALRAFERLRTALQADLGVEPGGNLQRLAQKIQHSM